MNNNERNNGGSGEDGPKGSFDSEDSVFELGLGIVGDKKNESKPCERDISDSSEFVLPLENDDPKGLDLSMSDIRPSADSSSFAALEALMLEADMEVVRAAVAGVSLGDRDILDGLFLNVQDQERVRKDLKFFSGRLRELISRNPDPARKRAEFAALLDVASIKRFKWVQDIVREFSNNTEFPHRTAALQALADNGEASAQKELDRLNAEDARRRRKQAAIDDLTKK